MPTTDEILEKARELGDLLAEHESAKKLEQAVSTLQNDTESQRAMNDYYRHLQSLAEKEASGQPIEPADKQKLQELQRNVVMNPNLRELQVAQMNYVDLLRKIDDAMTGQSGAPSPDAGASAMSPGGAAGGQPQGGGGLGLAGGGLARRRKFRAPIPPP